MCVISWESAFDSIFSLPEKRDDTHTLPANSCWYMYVNSDVRNPQTIFSLTKVMSTCPQLILDQPSSLDPQLNIILAGKIQPIKSYNEIDAFFLLT